MLVLVALCLALAWCVPSWGQVLKGSISGTVIDPQGAVVAGAQVKATQTGTENTQATQLRPLTKHYETLGENE